MRHVVGFSKTQFLGVDLLVTIFLATYNYDGGGRSATALPATGGDGDRRLFDALVDATDMNASAREFAEQLLNDDDDDDENAVDLQIKIPANEGFPFMGCGLVARVRGDRGTALSAHVPADYQWVGCDGAAHRIRALWQNATYGARFRLPGRERPVSVEIGIDEHATAQRGAVCVGLRAPAARPRAFCVDDALLVACDQMNSGRPDAHYADAANAWPFFGMSHATDSTASVVFRDVRALLGAFDALAADARDAAARATACRLIDTVRGASAPGPGDRAKCTTETDDDDRFVALQNCSEIVPLRTAAP